jgi:putative endonuclease
MWVVYLLLGNQKIIYTGITDDLKNRLRQHKNGQSKFTKRFKEIELIYTENFETKTKAAKREREIKGWSRNKKIEKLGLPSSLYSSG